MAPTFASQLHGWQGRVYATVDGAKYADLAAILQKCDVRCRSLFLEHRDPAVIAVGPYLAHFDGRADLDRFLAIKDITGACVFWNSDVAEPIVFRHLRSINLVDVPIKEKSGTEISGKRREVVLFRHWDPATIRLILPVLEPEQSSRLLGPMRRLAVVEQASQGLLVVNASASLPPPPRGPLRLTVVQMDRIGAAMQNRSHIAIAAFLRDMAPAHTADFTQPALLDIVAQSIRSGRELGLRGERALARWSYLLLVSNGKMAHSQARAFITSGPESPDVRIGLLMLGITRALWNRDVAA